MVVVPIILFLLAAVALAIGVLGLAGKLPRNRFVGVHTDEALSNDEVFRVANRVAAPTSLAAGALLFCGGLVTLAAGGFAVVLIALGVAIIALLTHGPGAPPRAPPPPPPPPPPPTPPRGHNHAGRVVGVGGAAAPPAYTPESAIMNPCV
ncbi:SdpI family protein [Nocardia cyriacigeorgica]|uniref:SdpI family protein n=1 Tax=Nocardia cyriacigeorgica TaxID=135487 RepID=UPI002456D664|nr:SdpI family protein [Nocardia cyriacigeorgica]